MMNGQKLLNNVYPVALTLLLVNLFTTLNATKTSSLSFKEEFINHLLIFCKTDLCYADIIYDKPLNESFKKKIELVQYNVVLIITGAIKGTCRDKIYQ